MTLAPKGYLSRLIDSEISELLKEFNAVSIEGPKWCGKTWSALNQANSVAYIADPAGGFSNRKQALIDPMLVLEGKRPRLLDEWQEVPGLWDAVRFVSDQDRKKGKFLLTGSATPNDESIMHSGAGRIARIRMRTMSLFESGESKGGISLARLFEGDPIKPQASRMSQKELIDLAVRGGWPANVHPDSGEEMNPIRLPRQYLEAVASVDIHMIDGTRRDPGKVKLLFKALARNNATTASLTTLSRDIKEEDARSVERETVSAYIRDLTRLFLIEEIPAWTPKLRSRARVRTSPKRLFADPSLAVAGLNATAQMLERDLNTFGFIFEGLCLRDLLVYAEVFGGRVFHYRDNTGLEADAIIELRDGRWGAFEIKLGAYQVDSAAESLLKLKRKMVEGGVQPPSCLCVIVGVGSAGYMRDDGVAVVPIDLLRE